MVDHKCHSMAAVTAPQYRMLHVPTWNSVLSLVRKSLWHAAENDDWTFMTMTMKVCSNVGFVQAI